jgi:hypothetical protein
MPAKLLSTRFPFLIALCFVALLLGAVRAEDTDPESIPLFDGQTLSGWTDQGGDPVSEGWTVENGLLVREGRGGAIYAEQEYENFILEFEWRIAKGGNSGVKYRVQFYEDGLWNKPGWLGYEYQIYGDKNPQPSKSSAGALYALYAPCDERILRAPDEFNQSRIVVNGTHIEHWLNEMKIVDADISTQDFQTRVQECKFNQVDDFGQNMSGRIQIQDHGSNVAYRNITIQVLPSETEKPATASAQGSASRRPLVNSVQESGLLGRRRQ